MAALSFGYATPISGQFTPWMSKDENLVFSKLQETCQSISAKRSCQISVNAIKPTHLLSNNTNTTTNTTNIEYHLSLTGTMDALLAARGDLLAKCPLEIKLNIQIPPTMKLISLTDRLESLQAELNTKITIIPEKQCHYSLISDNMVSIDIVGNPVQVEQCRVRVLVLLDELLKNFKVDTLRLPLKLQYLICGRKRASLLPIIEETSTNIYFPSPFIHSTMFLDNDVELKHQKNELQDHDSLIYITGEANNVSRVKDMLTKLAIQKAKSMYHKDTAIHARKIDWLLLNRRDELRRIMHDNGAYIEFPPLGSSESRITVFAENRVNAERTLRALNHQACQIYEACFYFNNQEGDMYEGAHNFFDSTANLSNLVTELSRVSGSEVIYKTDSGVIEVLGSERAIRNVYQRLQEMQFLQNFHQHTIFRVESSTEQRDFISGKKNGKINKIMKTSGAKIKFYPFINDYNFIIEVESTSFTKALDGLTLLQEELPAEISFYVPESYHKRIIGVGGKNIQRIMKKYGVYVKFSNTEEFASLGGYYNNEDNVVARTPMKNQINLDNLRHAVMELINPKDRKFVSESIHIPFDLHRELISEYQANFVAEELIKKTNTHILWPDAELASSVVELMGPEAHLSTAIKMLENIIPETYILHFPYDKSTYQEKIQSDLFNEKIVHVLCDKFNILVESFVCSEQDACIRLNMTRDKILTQLHVALDLVIEYLKKENVPLYDNTDASHLFAAVEQKCSSNIKNTSSTNDSNNLLESSTLLKHAPVLKSSSTASMMRATSDSVYKTSNMTNSAFQNHSFFNFNSNNMDNWSSLQPVTSHSTPNSSSDKNIRAIFDAPMNVAEQERMMMSNYHYQQRMSMPPTSNFGFPQTSTSSDIWSSRRSSTSFSSSTMASPPTRNKTYGSSTPESMRVKRFNDGGNGIFYPAPIQQKNEFNPYTDLSSTALKTSQSMPEPILESHFTNRNGAFKSSLNSFHPNVNHQGQHYNKLNMNTFRGPNSTYSTKSTTPEDNKHQQFFSNNDTNKIPILGGFTSYEPHKVTNDNSDKAARPPPGIDV